MALGPRARVLLLAALVFAALAALVWYLSYGYWSQPVTPLRPPSNSTEALTPTPAATPQTTAAPPDGATPTPTASPTPSGQPTPTPSPQTLLQPQGGDVNATLASMRLLLPVQGVRADELRDTFNDSRSEGRVHDSIDIIAPRNSPVLAAADGRVVKLFRSVKGGITLYQLAAADELAEGHCARRGETLAYVGDTGNATPGNTHLHFQIYRVSDPRHFWTGDNVNPYPLLRGAQ